MSGRYAATYTQLDLGADDMKPVREALTLILDNHNPFPALVMDCSGAPPKLNILEAVF